MSQSRKRVKTIKTKTSSVTVISKAGQPDHIILRCRPDTMVEMSTIKYAGEKSVLPEPVMNHIGQGWQEAIRRAEEALKKSGMIKA